MNEPTKGPGLAIFQSAEQNEQLARDAQAIVDALHPGYVTFKVAAPQVVADDLELPLMPKPEAIKHPTDDSMGCVLFSSRQMQDYARCALQAAPVQAQEPVAYADPKAFDNFKADACANEWMWAKPYSGYVPLYRAPVQPVAVPDGWKLVPIEPTDEMRDACHTLNYQDEIDAEWKAMLAAAPAAPAAQGDAKDTERMNFLVMKIVDVRQELRYGSRLEFTSQARYENDGTDTFIGTSLREKIDAAIAAKAAIMRKQMRELKGMKCTP